MRPVVLMSCGITEDGSTFQGRINYVQALAAAGASVLVVPVQSAAAVRDLAALAQGILLPGGGDIDPLLFGEEALLANGRVEPLVDAVDLELARLALQQGKPVLAICRGCQVLNVAAGGTLIQDLPSAHVTGQQHSQKAPRWHASHRITIEAGSLLSHILETDALLVNSFHHQAVRLPGSGLAVTAHAADGVVEAVEMPGHSFALGVQWHPECMVDQHPLQRQIFNAFVAACSSYNPEPGGGRDERSAGASDPGRRG